MEVSRKKKSSSTSDCKEEISEDDVIPSSQSITKPRLSLLDSQVIEKKSSLELKEKNISNNSIQCTQPEIIESQEIFCGQGTPAKNIDLASCSDSNLFFDEELENSQECRTKNDNYKNDSVVSRCNETKTSTCKWKPKKRCKRYVDSSDSGMLISDETNYEGEEIILSGKKRKKLIPPRYAECKHIREKLDDIDSNIFDSITQKHNDIFDMKYDTDNFMESYLTKTLDGEFLTSLVKQIEEFWSYSDELVEKLENLDIKIDWKLPELHKSKNVLSKKNLKNVNCSKFEHEENLKIIENWKHFCKIYDFDPKDYRPFVYQPLKFDAYTITKRKRIKIKFCQFLARGLPDRLPSRVHNRFNEMCRYNKRGKFSHAEDQLILNLYNHLKTTKRLFSICSIILRRSRYIVWRRFHTILANDYNLKVYRGSCAYYQMNEQSVIKLASALTPYREKNIEIDVKIINGVCKKIKIDPTIGEVLYYAKVFPLTTKKNIYKYKFRADIIEGLQGATDWNSDIWEKLGSSLSDVGQIFVYSEFRRMVKEEVPHKKWSNLKHVVDYLQKNVYKKYLKRSKADVPLKRLKLGKLVLNGTSRSKLSRRLNYTVEI